MDALSALEEQNRDALALARYAAIASRIEPALLRALRFELLPHADVSAEADVWWSGLVDLRAADAVRFSPLALEQLYAWLTERPQLARDAYRIVRRVHRDASPFARLQEWLSYRALLTPHHPFVAGTLAAVVGTIVRGDAWRDEAAAWAVAALPRLPSVLRDLPAFWSLAFAANRYGRGVVVLDGSSSAAAIFEAAGLVSGVVASADRIEIEIGRDGDDLLLRRSDRPLALGGLTVPDVSPLVIAVESGDESRVVVVDGHKWTPVRVTSLPVTIEAIDGSIYELHPRAASAEAAAAPDPRRSVGEVVGQSGNVVSVAYLVRPNLAATAGAFTFEEKYIVHIADIEGGGRAGEVISIEERGGIVYLLLDPPVDSSVPPLPLAPTLIRGASVTVLGGHGEATDGIFTSSDTIGLPRPDEIHQPYNGAPIVQGDLVLAHVLHSNEGTAYFRAAFLVAMHVHRAARLAAAIELVRHREPAEDLRGSIAALKLDAVEVHRLWGSSHDERRWVALVAITEGKLVDCSRIVREALHRGSEEERAEAEKAMEALSGSSPARSRADFGVVIGIEHYKFFQRFSVATADARRFHEWLCHRDGGSLDEKNVKLILSSPEEREPKPIHDQIDEMILKVLEAAQASGGGHRLYFYFSGFGTTNERSGIDIALLLPQWSEENASRHALSLASYVSTLCGTGIFEEVVVVADWQRSTSIKVVGLPPTITWKTDTPPFPTRTFIALMAEDGSASLGPPGSGGPHGMLTRCLLSILGRTPGIRALRLEDLLKREIEAEGRRFDVYQRVRVENKLTAGSYFGRRGVRPGVNTRLRCAIVPENDILGAQLAQSPWLQLVEAIEAEVRLEQVGDRWVVTDDVHGVEPGAELVALTGEQLDRARVVLEHYYIYALPLRMADAVEDPGALQLRVLRADLSPVEAQSPSLNELPLAASTLGTYVYEAIDGAEVCIEVTNMSEERLRVTLLNSASSGKVQLLGDQVIERSSSRIFWAQGNLGKPFTMNLPAGKQQAIDRLTVLGTNRLTADLGYLRWDRMFTDAAPWSVKDIAPPPEERAPPDKQWTAGRAIVKTRAK